ncbi:MAG TPA: hypothetical protein VGQ37_00280 [Vicinamibacterales bacterium]|nr:hypothetical protein [Vicinamibacterales bacterium]
MELRDGFIVGVHNYCDRWCERCAFTSYCRVFADVAGLDASFDPHLKAIVEAPLLEGPEPPMPAWMHERTADEASMTMSAWEWEQCRPGIPPEHQPIDARAASYAIRLDEWLKGRHGAGPWTTDPRCAEITWLSTVIAMKINRALNVSPDDDAAEHVWSSDQNGSAKVALIAIERSHAAWRDLVERGVTSRDEAQTFIADLAWLHEALERARPHARRFVRPAFDETDEVAKLRS